MARLKLAVLVLVALSASTNLVQAASSVWTSSGKTLVLSTADWTLFAPIRDAKGDGKGVFVNGTKIFTFPASKNKNKPAVKSDGTTKAATLNFNVLLTPATVTAGQLTEGTTPTGRDKISLRIAMKLPKGAKFEAMTNLLFQTQSTAFPYAALYAGASQAVPKELTGASAFKLGKPSIKDGRNKKVLLSTSGATFRLAQESAVSVLCKSGYGGTLVAGGNATASGCAICAAGNYGSQLDQQTACKSCKGTGGYSDTQGAVACKNCTTGQAPNDAATGCVPGNGTGSAVTFSYVLTLGGGACDSAAIDTSVTNYINGLTGVQPGSASVTVTCSTFEARRRLLETVNGAIVAGSYNCLTPPCTQAQDNLNNQMAICCEASPNSNCMLAPLNPVCTGSTPDMLTCPQNEYISNSTCKKCGNGATTPAANQLLTCKCDGTAKYSTKSDTCVCDTGSYTPGKGCSNDACPVGEYEDPTSKLCYPCPLGCTACKDASTCTACKDGDDTQLRQIADGYKASAFFLAPDPTPGYWLNPDTQTCDQCMANCLKCSSASTCSVAMFGWTVNSGILMQECGANCAECEVDGAVVGACIACEAGYRLTGTTCTACGGGGALACADCTASAGTTCAKCKRGHGFSAPGTCTACDGYAGTPTTGGTCTYGFCGAVDTECLECTPSNAEIQQNNYYYSSAIKSCTVCSNIGTSNPQTPGSGQCAKCSTDPAKCEECATGSYLASDGRCMACPLNCLECESSAQCTVCKAGTYLNTAKQCVACAPSSGQPCRACDKAGTCTACQPGAYLNRTSMTCVACTAPATECSSASIATDCEDNYFVYNGACKLCGNDCAVCTSTAAGAFDKCLVCAGGKELDANGKCVYTTGTACNTAGLALTCPDYTSLDTLSATLIEGLSISEAQRTCCVYAAGATCDNLDAGAAGPVFAAADCIPATTTPATALTTAIAAETIETASLTCCVYSNVDATCDDVAGTGTNIKFDYCAPATYDPSQDGTKIVGQTPTDVATTTNTPTCCV